MGRGRGSTKAAKETGSSRASEKTSRATRGARKSYVEDEGSEEEYKDDVVSSPEDVAADSGSEFDAESSGSEYGKKKKKVKASPKKTPAKRGRKPAGKAQLSPKKRGRKPKAAVAAAASANGKRKRAAESSDEEEEKISSEGSDDDVSASGETSGSEYGKKKAGHKKMKKEKPPTRSQPRRQAAPSPKKRGRKPKDATNGNGNKKPKLAEVIEDDISEEDMVVDEAEKKSEEAIATTDDEAKKGSDDAGASEKKNSKEKDEKIVEDDNDEKSEPADSPKSEEAEEKDESESDDAGSSKVEAAPKKKEKTQSGSKPESTLMNRTETDFDSLNLTCDKKTSSGETWNFKIACWNVAGIKAWIKKQGLQYLKVEDPDIMCLQETKCSEKTKPAELKSIANYPHTYWCYAEEANGHNGVATLCKVKPESVSNGIPVADEDSEEDKKFKRSFNKEGRLIVTEFEKFYLLNAYVPNGGRGVKDDKHPRGYPPRVTNGERQAWDRLFRGYIKTLEEKKPVVVTGDFNVAHEPIDLANPKTNTNSAGFTQEERDGFTELLSSTKLVDSFRSLYPEEKAYTFWTYMGNARGKNVGWRLDYFLVSEKLQESLCESTIRKDVYGSDHCPIVLFAHF